MKGRSKTKAGGWWLGIQRRVKSLSQNGSPFWSTLGQDVQALSEAAAREFGNIDIWVRT